MKNIIFLFLFIPLITQAQILNGDFELWGDTSFSSYRIDLVAAGVINPVSAMPKYWNSDITYGVDRVDNSQSGNYAVMVYTWYHYAPGEIYQTIYNAIRPDSLSGYYMLNLNGADAMYAERYIEVSVLSLGDTIGYGKLSFDSSMTYNYFSLGVDYSSSAVPDSTVIKVRSMGASPGNLPPPVNTLIFLDDLQLHSSTTAIFDAEVNPNMMKAYPNPVQDVLTMDCKAKGLCYFKIMDISGNVIDQGSFTGKREVYMDTYPAGLYILTLEDNASNRRALKLNKQ